MCELYFLLADLEYDPIYYENIFKYKAKMPMLMQMPWLEKWLSQVLEIKDWKRAEEICYSTLDLIEAEWEDNYTENEVVQKKIQIYKQLEIIYSNWDKSKLNFLWGKLGKT